jgi:hypothetical protein
MNWNWILFFFIPLINSELQDQDVSSLLANPSDIEGDVSRHESYSVDNVHSKVTTSSVNLINLQTEEQEDILLISDPSETQSSVTGVRSLQDATSAPSEIKPDPNLLLTESPSETATESPTPIPTRIPTRRPTRRPSRRPTRRPTPRPTDFPTPFPSVITEEPSAMPTKRPTRRPTRRQTRTPTTSLPTLIPSLLPTAHPSRDSGERPSHEPTMNPSRNSDERPSRAPAESPSREPSSSTKPIFDATNLPTKRPVNPDDPSDKLSQLIKDAKASILDTIAQNRSLAANYLRLGFHDCVPNGPAGGCDGCINLVTNPENSGLHLSLDALDPIVAEFEDLKLGFSRADIWALATLVAADASQDQLEFSTAFVPGRQNCETVGTCRLRPEIKCSREGPDRPADFPTTILTTHELIDFMNEHFGFNVNETVALLGAHTLGTALPEHSGYEGQNGWVTDRFTLGM